MQCLFLNAEYENTIEVRWEKENDFFVLKIVSDYISVAVYWLKKMHIKKAKYIEHWMYVKDKNVQQLQGKLKILKLGSSTWWNL